MPCSNPLYSAVLHVPSPRATCRAIRSEPMRRIKAHFEFGPGFGSQEPSKCKTPCKIGRAGANKFSIGALSAATIPRMTSDSESPCVVHAATCHPVLVTHAAHPPAVPPDVSPAPSELGLG